MIHRGIYSVIVASIVAVLLALGASEAQAEEFPTTDPVHYPMIESLEPVAQAYWAGRGVALPTPVEVFVIADTAAGGAFGEEPGNRIWITQGEIERRGRAGRSFLCMTYLHERGHNAGLSHESGYPIMATNPWEHLTRVVPKCFQWADIVFRAALR